MAIVPLVVAALVSTAGADHPPGEGHPGHCPDHQDAPKDEDPEAGGVSSLDVDGTTVWLHYSDDLETVEFYADEEGTEPLAVDFCVKAANRNSGEHTGTSFTVDWTTGGGQTPEISYVVVYAIADGDGCPTELTLSPPDATNEPGDTHTVTATVTDPGGDPCEGVEVLFEVDPAEGAEPSTDTDTTNEDGEATFSYTRDGESSDTITACTTDEGDAPAQCDTAEHIHDTATKTWEDEVVTDGLTCRANLLAVALAGNDLPNLFEANPPSDPCVAEQDGLLVALSPLLGDGGLGVLNDENQIELTDPSGTQDGFIIVDALWADTATDESTFASAGSGVLLLHVNDGTDDQIMVEVLTSESETSSDCETTTSAEVVRLFLGGEEIRIPGEHTVLLAPELFEVIELHLEDAGDDGADEGPDDTGAQAADLAALAGNLTAAVADSETGCS